MNLTEIILFPIGEIQAPKHQSEVLHGLHFLNQKKWDMDDPSVRIWHEHEQWQFPTNKRFAFPVWELDSPRETGLCQLNKCNGVLVPSAWQADSYLRAAGANSAAPTAVVPEGVDTDVFRPRPAFRGSPQRVTRFVHLGKVEKRKGTMELARAWANKYKGDDTKILDMYIHNPFVPQYKIDEINGILTRMSRNIRVHWTPLNNEEKVAGIFAEAHIALFASRAEGWGLPILEAMACGCRVVTPIHTGISAYATPDTVFEVAKGPLTVAKDGLFFHGEGLWHDIREESIEDALELAVDDLMVSNEVIFEPAVEQARKFTWNSAAEILLKSIESLTSGQHGT